MSLSLQSTVALALLLQARVKHAFIRICIKLQYCVHSVQILCFCNNTMMLNHIDSQDEIVNHVYIQIADCQLKTTPCIYYKLCNDSIITMVWMSFTCHIVWIVLDSYKLVYFM